MATAKGPSFRLGEGRTAFAVSAVELAAVVPLADCAALLPWAGLLVPGVMLGVSFGGSARWAGVGLTSGFTRFGWGNVGSGRGSCSAVSAGDNGAYGSSHCGGFGWLVCIRRSLRLLKADFWGWCS